MMIKMGDWLRKPHYWYLLVVVALQAVFVVGLVDAIIDPNAMWGANAYRTFAVIWLTVDLVLAGGYWLVLRALHHRQHHA